MRRERNAADELVRVKLRAGRGSALHVPVHFDNLDAKLACRYGSTAMVHIGSSVVIAGHSASKTRINALVTRQSIISTQKSLFDGCPGQARA
jgi:hypothetical protein